MENIIVLNVDFCLLQQQQHQQQPNKCKETYAPVSSYAVFYTTGCKKCLVVINDINKYLRNDDA